MLKNPLWIFGIFEIFGFKHINRNFPEEELEKFFSVIGNEKHLTCFKLQAYLGLRISEAAKANISDIDFNRKKIRVYSQMSEFSVYSVKR